MPVITIFNGVYCKSKEIEKKILTKTGYKLITDRDIVSAASKMSDIPEDKIMKTFFEKTSVFNRFTHEKERSISQLKLALASMLVQDDIIISGFSGLLIPRDISHVLHVCIIADVKSRIAEAMKREKVSEKEAVGQIKRFRLNPGYQLCYCLGNYEIKKLRNTYAGRIGLSEFHHILLGGGELPFHLIEKRLEASLNQNTRSIN